MSRDDDLKALVADLAKQFVKAVDETRVRTIEECAEYIENKNPCACRQLTAKAIRQLASWEPGDSDGK